MLLDFDIWLVIKSMQSTESYSGVMGNSLLFPPLYIGSVLGRRFFPVMNKVKSPPSPKRNLKKKLDNVFRLKCYFCHFDTFINAVAYFRVSDNKNISGL